MYPGGWEMGDLEKLIARPPSEFDVIDDRGYDVVKPRAIFPTMP